MHNHPRSLHRTPRGLRGQRPSGLLPIPWALPTPPSRRRRRCHDRAAGNRHLPSPLPAVNGSNRRAAGAGRPGCRGDGAGAPLRGGGAGGGAAGGQVRAGPRAPGGISGGAGGCAGARGALLLRALSLRGCGCVETDAKSRGNQGGAVFGRGKKAGAARPAPGGKEGELWGSPRFPWLGGTDLGWGQKQARRIKKFSKCKSKVCAKQAKLTKASSSRLCKSQSKYLKLLPIK